MVMSSRGRSADTLPFRSNSGSVKAGSSTSISASIHNFHPRCQSRLRSLISRFRIPLTIVTLGLFAVWLFADRFAPDCPWTSSSGLCVAGPAKGPLRMSSNERADWHVRLASAVAKVAEHDGTVPIVTTSSDTGVSVVNLNLNLNRATTESSSTTTTTTTSSAAANGERILIATPLKDAAPFLRRYFDILDQMTYPRDLIDLAFIVGDCRDNTLGILTAELDRLQNTKNTKHKKDKNGNSRFRSVTVVKRDFGTDMRQDVNARHHFAAQAPRRIAMARARNFLLSAALGVDHDWVLWRDVDVEESPPSVIEDMTALDRDVVVPNVWFRRDKVVGGKTTTIEGRFDYNSWQETAESREYLKTLGPDVILAEGYRQFPTRRRHMALLGDPTSGNLTETIPLDGVGGVVLLVKADVHRSGVNFPTFPFEHQVETEGFGRMANRAGFGVFGMPNYVVWHVDTGEEGGNV